MWELFGRFRCKFGLLLDCFINNVDLFIYLFIFSIDILKILFWVGLYFNLNNEFSY